MLWSWTWRALTSVRCAMELACVKQELRRLHTPGSCCILLLLPLQLPSWLQATLWHPRHLGWQVRRKADPAKALVKEWVSRWRDERTVTSEVSYKQINGKRLSCCPLWGQVRLILLVHRFVKGAIMANFAGLLCPVLRDMPLKHNALSDRAVHPKARRALAWPGHALTRCFLRRYAAAGQSVAHAAWPLSFLPVVRAP